MLKLFSIIPTLADISHQSSYVQDTVGITRCKFLYKQRHSTTPEVIGCEPYIIFIENQIFILATIVFTHGYEGVSSSFVTVSPPVVVIQKLKDLLNHGYRILNLERGNMRTYALVFTRENITGDVRRWIDWIPWSRDQRVRNSLFIFCQVVQIEIMSK